MDLKVAYTDIQATDMLVDLQDRDVILVPVGAVGDIHPMHIQPSIVVIVPVEDPIQTYYVLANAHDEVPTTAHAALSTWQHTGKLYTPDKKLLLHTFPRLGKRAIDAIGLEYLNTGQYKPSRLIPSCMADLANRCDGQTDHVPLMVLMRYAQALIEKSLRVILQHGAVGETVAFRFHNNIVLPVLWGMERSGIHVDPVLFAQHYPAHIVEGAVDGSWVYTEYTPYTATGRIVGRHRGFQSSAIKKGDTRSAFTSRFGQDGTLLLIDFESFHLRLIADAMGYVLPDMPVHEYLAQIYFNTSTVTPDQYDEGKQITFRLLYDDTQSVDHIPFFSAVRTFVAQKWYEFVRDGFAITPSGRIIWKDGIAEPSPKKLFAYFFQLREMEVAMIGLYKLIGSMAKFKSKLTIYTYDSILIDCYTPELSNVVQLATTHLTHAGKFPVRMGVGPNYRDLVSHVP